MTDHAARHREARAARRRSALGTVAGLMPPVLLSVGLAELGLVIARAVIDPAVLHETNDVVGNYLQTLGTVYAVLLAFVVFVVWQQFNDARGYVEREANELLDLYRTTRGLPTPTRAEVQRHLEAYVEAVIAREWPAMTCGDGDVREEVSRLVDQLWDELHGYEPVTECTKTIYGELLVRLNDLSDLRTNRLTAASLHIPLALKILLYFGAVIMVASMWLFAVDNFAVHAFLTGALAGALSHVLYVVHDLDRPFAGDWQVPRSAFVRVRDYMREHAG